MSAAKAAGLLPPPDAPKDSSLGTVRNGKNVSAGGGKVHLYKMLKKTKLCTYQNGGQCFYSDACDFAHSEEELQRPPDMSMTSLCGSLNGGICIGRHCRFAHSQDDLRATDMFYKRTLCMWFAKNKCNNGANCRFAHGNSELRGGHRSTAKIAAVERDRQMGSRKPPSADKSAFWPRPDLSDTSDFASRSSQGYSPALSADGSQDEPQIPCDPILPLWRHVPAVAGRFCTPPDSMLKFAGSVHDRPSDADILSPYNRTSDAPPVDNPLLWRFQQKEWRFQSKEVTPSRDAWDGVDPIPKAHELLRNAAWPRTTEIWTLQL